VGVEVAVDVDEGIKGGRIVVNNESTVVGVGDGGVGEGVGGEVEGIGESRASKCRSESAFVGVVGEGGRRRGTDGSDGLDGVDGSGGGNVVEVVDVVGEGRGSRVVLVKGAPFNSSHVVELWAVVS
jgi:hypothetical protein